MRQRKGRRHRQIHREKIMGEWKQRLECKPRNAEAPSRSSRVHCPGSDCRPPKL